MLQNNLVQGDGENVKNRWEYRGKKIFQEFIILNVGHGKILISQIIRHLSLKIFLNSHTMILIFSCCSIFEVTPVVCIHFYGFRTVPVKYTFITKITILSLPKLFTSSLSQVTPNYSSLLFHSTHGLSFSILLCSTSCIPTV